MTLEIELNAIDEAQEIEKEIDAHLPYVRDNVLVWQNIEFDVEALSERIQRQSTYLRHKQAGRMKEIARLNEEGRTKARTHKWDCKTGGYTAERR